MILLKNTSSVFQNITKHLFFTLKMLQSVFRAKNTLKKHYQTGLKCSDQNTTLYKAFTTFPLIFTTLKEYVLAILID